MSHIDVCLLFERRRWNIRSNHGNSKGNFHLRKVRLCKNENYCKGLYFKTIMFSARSTILFNARVYPSWNEEDLRSPPFIGTYLAKLHEPGEVFDKTHDWAIWSVKNLSSISTCVYVHLTDLIIRSCASFRKNLHSLYLPECLETSCLKQAPYLKFTVHLQTKWLWVSILNNTS